MNEEGQACDRFVEQELQAYEGACDKKFEANEWASDRMDVTRMEVADEWACDRMNMTSIEGADEWACDKEGMARLVGSLEVVRVRNFKGIFQGLRVAQAAVTERWP